MKKKITHMRRSLGFRFQKHNLKGALGNLVPNKIGIPGNFNFQKKEEKKNFY